MAGRFYFAWRMFAAAQAQDDKNYKASVDARARASFDPLLHLTQKEFKARYRFTKQGFKFLCKELRLLTTLRSSQRVSLEHKVLTALLFFATGSYQRPVGVAKHTSLKMCSVYIEQVTQALTHKNIIIKYIKFPNTPAARLEVSQRFHRKYGMPGAVGCIDGSHFKIVVPSKEVVCDDEYRILNVNPKFGGANHDSFIWENSDLYPYMKSLYQNGEILWLLGDSGYPQRPWLMTPYSDAEAETNTVCKIFNEKHIRTRVVIENTFSRLKNRWRCLHKDRVLHYKPLKCSRIILACSVLHNMIINLGIEDTQMLEDIGLEFQEEQSQHSSYVESGEATSDLISGRILRDQVARRLQSTIINE